jgi:hypothetical protein
MKLPLRGSYSLRCSWILHSLHNPNDHCRCHNIPALDPILHYINLVVHSHALTPKYFKTNLLLSSLTGRNSLDILTFFHRKLLVNFFAANRQTHFCVTLVFFELQQRWQKSSHPQNLYLKEYIRDYPFKNEAQTALLKPQSVPRSKNFSSGL